MMPRLLVLSQMRGQAEYKYGGRGVVGFRRLRAWDVSRRWTRVPDIGRSFAKQSQEDEGRNYRRAKQTKCLTLFRSVFGTFTAPVKRGAGFVGRADRKTARARCHWSGRGWLIREGGSPQHQHQHQQLHRDRGASVPVSVAERDSPVPVPVCLIPILCF